MSKSIVIKGGLVINRDSQKIVDLKIENDILTEISKNQKGDIQQHASSFMVSS